MKLEKFLSPTEQPTVGPPPTKVSRVNPRRGQLAKGATVPAWAEGAASRPSPAVSPNRASRFRFFIVLN